MPQAFEDTPTTDKGKAPGQSPWSSIIPISPSSLLELDPNIGCALGKPLAAATCSVIAMLERSS